METNNQSRENLWVMIMIAVALVALFLSIYFWWNGRNDFAFILIVVVAVLWFLRLRGQLRKSFIAKVNKFKITDTDEDKKV